MKFFDLFRPKPKCCCTACGAAAPGLHDVYPGLHGGQLTDRLCTGCLLTRLRTAVSGKSILFIAPLVSECYTYTPFSAIAYPCAIERMQLAFAAMGPQCAACAQPPAHLWMPQEDLDMQAMESQPTHGYGSIPCEPSVWHGTRALCDEHLIGHLSDYLTQKRCYFSTFRFPDASRSGYYD